MIACICCSAACGLSDRVIMRRRSAAMLPWNLPGRLLIGCRLGGRLAMGRTLSITLLAAVLFGASGSASAQKVEAGVYGGWHIFSSKNELGAIEGEQDNIVADS